MIRPTRRRPRGGSVPAHATGGCRWRCSTRSRSAPPRAGAPLDNGQALVRDELSAVAAFVPDVGRMRASGVPLTVVAGEESRGTWLGAAAEWLAAGTGAERATLPGGHVGFVTHPEAFIRLVRRVAS